MSDIKFHIKPCKTAITLFVLLFSLSPCAVKREILEIFDIQHLSTLNKVKTTASSKSQCLTFSEKTSKISVSKSIKKLHQQKFIDVVVSQINWEGKIFKNSYSEFPTGKSPPKYILFKRLKLDLA